MWVKLLMWLKIRRLGPPFIHLKPSFMSREVPPPSKNKTSEKWFHSLPGPSPVGRSRPTAVPPFNGSKVSLSAPWIGPRPHVLSHFCQSPHPLFATVKYETTLTLSQGRAESKAPRRWGRRGRDAAGGTRSTPRSRRGPIPARRPTWSGRGSAKTLQGLECGRRAHHCTHRARLRLPRRSPGGGQSSQLPYPLLSD